MNLSALLNALTSHPDSALRLLLPDGSTVPPHFHVTEVGRVRKDFIDCGGTLRSLERCLLQVWTADDSAHRVTAGKLAKIIRLAQPLLGGNDLQVEIEYDLGVITQLPVTSIHATDAEISFTRGGKHTACLGSDRCGVPETGNTPACCTPPASVPLTVGSRK